MNQNRLADLESALGYSFSNRALLERALTHSSFYKGEKGRREPQDNERMEFLGDAVLELLSSEFLYEKFPEIEENENYENNFKINGRKVLKSRTMAQNKINYSDIIVINREKI